MHVRAPNIEASESYLSVNEQENSSQLGEVRIICEVASGGMEKLAALSAPASHI